MFRATSLTPTTAPTIRRLQAVNPTTLAIMHGSSFTGDCAKTLSRCARRCYAERLVATG